MPIVKHVTEGQCQRKNDKHSADAVGFGKRLCYHEILTVGYRTSINDFTEQCSRDIYPA